MSVKENIIAIPMQCARIEQDRMTVAATKGIAAMASPVTIFAWKEVNFVTRKLLANSMVHRINVNAIRDIRAMARIVMMLTSAWTSA